MYERITYPILSDNAEEYERIDKIRITGMKYVEKICMKL